MPAPKKLTPLVDTKLSKAVCRYINKHFDGNLSVAAEALGCDYDGLRNTALGTIKRVNLPVIQKLAKHSGDTIEGWIN
jgi:hypothetical protein